MSQKGTDQDTVEKHKVESELIDLKMQKSRCKAAYTRMRNRLQDVCDSEDSTKEELKHALDKVEQAMDNATESVNNIATFLKQGGRTDEMIKTLEEVSVFESQYEEVLQSYRQCQSELASNASSGKQENEQENDTVQKKLGQDMWRQMKRVSIPTFYGEKRKFESWKAAFYACVDCAPATEEYKLLQLRQYVQGDALKCIEDLGHSASAYQAAKDRLERKFGGQRRQMAIFMEELDEFTPIRVENAKAVDKCADLMDIVVINLKEADRHEDLNDGPLYYKLQRKLPESMLTRYHRWVKENSKEENVETLRHWVIQEAEYMTIAAETVNGVDKQKSSSQTKNRTIKHNSYLSDAKKPFERYKRTCSACNENHSVWDCNKFKSMKVPDRWTMCKDKHLCFRCLKDNHRGSDCRNYRKCEIDGCLKTHNKLLHERIKPSNGLDINATEFAPNQQSFTSTTTINAIGLRTIPVVLTANNKSLKVNALLDDGSTKTYINQDVAAELGLQGRLEYMEVNVLNGQKECFKTMAVNFIVSSENGSVNVPIEAHTTNNVTGSLKPIDWTKCKQEWKHLNEITFPKLSKQSNVDILIGLDYSDLHRCIQEVHGGQGEPIARLTPLGWTCVGPSNNNVCKNEIESYFTLFVGGETDRTLRRFWEIETVESMNTSTMSRSDEIALKIAEQSLVKQSDKYEVGMPWKENRQALPNNYQMALNRLKNTEKRLKKDPAVAQVYQETIDSYLNKGYISKVHEAEPEAWYLPHFPVIRPDKQTTKVRIVFDASAKYQDVSLNDQIYQGPKLQNALHDVLLRFRQRPVALVCDIAEMYLRVGMAEPDRRYHRFLWNSQCDPPEIYQFNRLVFGVNASPFLAQFVAQQNALQFQKEYPLAAETVLKSTYMDDSMDSANNDQDAIELYKQLSTLWGKAGMHARKWLSNSATVLREIPETDRKVEVDLAKGELPQTKTLGVLWSANDDEFKFQYNIPELDQVWTKRIFLKQIATIFDPMGFIAPYIIRGKVIMQEIWLSGEDWDEALTTNTSSKIKSWFEELHMLQDIKVPRCLQREVNDSQKKSISIHTFVDASTIAYGAVTYVRTLYQNEDVTVRLVMSKSRVAPLEAISIPRLELMAAILGLRLTIIICSALSIDMDKATLWSDSMNVLYWIRNQSRLFKPFVANRIGEIHRTTSSSQWRKVPTSENPADHVSRGLTVHALAENQNWWEGPRFLHKPEEDWPENKIDQTVVTETEAKAKSKQSNQLFMTTNEEIAVQQYPWKLDPGRFSSWRRLIRIVSWVCRFIANCRGNSTTGPLTVDEIRDGEQKMIKKAQKDAFCNEIKALKGSGKLPKDSKILSLNPKLDEDGVLRADSRLTYAEFLPTSVRFPVILPRKHSVTKLIVRKCHEETNHSGTNRTLSALSTNYWVVCAREEIHDVEKDCTECRRRKARPTNQIMAPLPAIRLEMPLRAFAHTSVDFGGPFITVQGRGKRREKRYLCLFTCLATRAVHLELAYGLDTNSFLNAFFRMVNRRGRPQKMLSDRGTNFIGADRELKELVQAIDTNTIVTRTADKGIEWQFNPPLSPHWGGVHEVMIKAAKRAIYGILRGADITDEELLTAFTGAEALINSRPLTYQSSHPADCVPLTPNHFLFGQCGGEFAPRTVDNTDYNPVRRWRRVQEVVRHFWYRWLKEWIPSLATRSKWHYGKRDLAVDDVVMVVSADTPRGQWPLGRILEIYPGPDSHVRAAKVRVGNSDFVRSITKLCPLELNNIYFKND